ILSSAWCRNCSGAVCSGGNTKARRSAKISACRGRRTDFSEPICCATSTRVELADDVRKNASMESRVRAACLAVWAASALPVPAAAWDFPGHRIVGAIADLVLQQHDPATQQRVSELLEKNDGGTVEKRSLSEVAVFPDCAKRGNVPFCGRPPSEEEKAYAGRNPHHDKIPLRRRAAAATELRRQQCRYARHRRRADDRIRGRPIAGQSADAQARRQPHRHRSGVAARPPRRRHPSTAACGGEILR